MTLWKIIKIYGMKREQLYSGVTAQEVRDFMTAQAAMYGDKKFTHALGPDNMTLTMEFMGQKTRFISEPIN